MEKLIIKIVNAHYKSDMDIKKLIKYIAADGRNSRKEKLLCRCGRGVSKKPDKAAEEMIILQKAFGKDKGRRMYHLIISFPKDMHDKDMIRKIAKRVSDMLFMDYQVFYGIHISRDNWHIHYAINAVNYRTGMKWHQNRTEFKEFKNTMIKLVNSIYEFK